MSDTRSLIEKEVGENPGISFSELKEITGLSNGVLQYHIHRSDQVEKRKGAILASDACENCGKRDKCGGKCLKKIMRDPKKKRIVEMKDDGRSQKEIAEELELARSTVSYHIRRLKELELLE